MPVTRSRAASLTRRDDASAFPVPSRPNTPTASPANENGGNDASSFSPHTDANATFTNDNVAMIIASLQRSQTEAFRELLNSVSRATSSTPDSHALLGYNTLARCKATFSGRPNESVEAFIDAIEAYSDCAQVADSNILRGLAYLFQADAATWWQGIKYSVSSWREAKENLISAYGDRRPPHRIYLEIFASPQDKENTDIFVARIRALMARLPSNDVTVSAQLDMTYGLLHSRIKKRLRREECTSFRQLLRLARNIEDSFDERSNSTPTTGERRTYTQQTRSPSTSTPSTPSALRDNASGRAQAYGAHAAAAAAPTQRPPAPLDPPAPAPPRRDSTATKQRPSCAYCKRYGHTRDQCRKLHNQADPLPGKHVPVESYESELEREHALPTSVPNADILKTNSNPTYHKPRPPQHHGAALLAGVGGGGAVPSYAPPGRAFFTPPLPPEYRNPFADKPTLRGTNTDGNNYLNRRPIPPPSLGPGHDRIPIRPPGQETSSPQVPAPPPAPPMPPAGIEPQKKKALNTPSHKPDELDSDIKQSGTDQANFTDFVPNSLNIPTISRILSGSNGRKEDIPDVLLRTVTSKPQHNQEKTSKSDIFVTKEVGVTLSDSSRDSSTEGSVLAVLDPEMNNLDRPLIVDQNGETNTRRNLQYATNKQTDRNDSRKDEYTPATTTGFQLKDPEMSTERYHNLANVNSDKKILKQDSKNSGPVQRPGAAWPFAWNLHIYLATVMFTILAVYSIFKIFCYNKYTHLFTQYYFIILHLILVLVCLLRIFYMCYDPYNINNSLPKFLSEILLHVPEIFLSIAFACIILFLLTNSINFKNTCCSFLLRPRIIIIGGSLHILSCLMLHIFESSNTINRNTQGVEKRVLGLTCQIIFIIACLTLGLCYLYVYKMLKTVLQKKSHTYINGFQNLQHAIQIKLATALLFILMAALQIFGIFGINQHNMTKFDWLQWGYQFSLRLLEVSIVALISWVISLKVGIALQHEKADGHKISGLGLFACGAGSSNEQFESDYPAICNTNTNLHTYTMRTGKPIYETTGHHPAMPDPCCAPVIDHQRFQLNTLTGNCDNNSGTENYSGHSSIANAGHSSSTESSNATSSQGVTNHLIKHHSNIAGYNGIESASDDHYSNCDPAIQSLQGDDPLDHEYNVIQYGSNSDFIRDIKNQNYNAGSNRSSHNFKHMSYDRVSSRTNSNPRKKHRAKNKNVQNCMTMGYDASIGHHYHQPHTPDEYGNYNTENASYHASGIQTLNPNRSYTNDPCQQIRSSQRRNSPSTSMVNSSGSQKRGKGNGFPDRPKSTDLYGFSEDPNERGYPCALGGTPQPAPRNCSYEASYSQPQDEIPTEAEGNSMLVAQDGFLRIRSMKDPSPNPQPSHT